MGTHVSHYSKTSLTTRKNMHFSTVILIACSTISFSMGSDTIDLTQDFLQNTLDSLNEVDQNQHRNESTSGSVVIKTFKNAIKTLIEESKNSVKPKLEFIDKVDKKTIYKQNKECYFWKLGFHNRQMEYHWKLEF